MKNQGEKLRELITKDTVVMPGAFNPLTAKLAEQIGFKALYISGAALSASQGLPDNGSLYWDKRTGIFNPTRYLKLAKDIIRATDLPVIVDIDTGFGNLENLKRAVRELEKAGAAGVQIEDQEFPKKCGHLDGKIVVDEMVMQQRIFAAIETRQKPSNDFIIVARTDIASAVNYPNNQDAFDIYKVLFRAHSYRAAGADVVFPEALKSKKEFWKFRKKLHLDKLPLLANMTEFGKTDYITAEEFKKMGYQIVIFPVSALRVAIKAIENFFIKLKQTGIQKDFLGEMQTRKELYNLLDYKP